MNVCDDHPRRGYLTAAKRWRRSSLALLAAVMAAMASLFPAACRAEGTADALEKYNVVWTAPSENVRGTMPIGNGDIGANVWMEPSGVFQILLSKTDAWDGNGQLCKLGKLSVKLDPNPFEGAATFRQVLDLHRGSIIIEAEHASHGKATLRFWIDANQPVARVEVDSSQPLAMEVAHHTWRTAQRELTGKNERDSLYGLHDREQRGVFPLIEYPDTILENQRGRIVFFHRNTTSIWKITLEAQALEALARTEADPLMNNTFGAIVSGPGLVSKAADKLASSQAANHHRVDIYPLTQRSTTADGWVAAVEQNISSIGKTPLDLARRNHERWWSDFWDRSWMFVTGDDQSEVVTRAYVLQRWINACGGRGQAPIKFNGSIFTVPGIGRQGEMTYNPDYRAWGSCYWWQNTRLPYWASLAPGDYDLMRPLFKMYLDALPLRKAATERYYHHAGAFYPETMYFFGTYNNENYGWNQQGPPGLTINRHIRYEWVAGIELSAMMLDYCSHTGDEKFLREEVLPFANEIVTFYAQHYPPKEGGDKLHIYPANSLEDIWDATNPAEVISGLRAILPRMIALTDEPRQKKYFEEVLAKVPELPTAKSRDGAPMFIAATAGKRRRNGEKSELYALFPFRLVNLRTPKELPLALEAYKHRARRGINGWVQDAIFAARLGLSDDAKAQLVARARTKDRGSRFPAFWGPNFDWTPDQDHGAINMIALQDMLMQPMGDKIVLLPAWPAAWDVDFKLHAPRQTVLEGSVRGGKVTELKVTPDSRRGDVVIYSKSAETAAP